MKVKIVEKNLLEDQKDEISKISSRARANFLLFSLPVIWLMIEDPAFIPLLLIFLFIVHHFIRFDVENKFNESNNLFFLDAEESIQNTRKNDIVSTFLKI